MISIRLIVCTETLDRYVKTSRELKRTESLPYFHRFANSRFVRIKGIFVLSDHPTPMAGVKGRHEARKRVCHRARTLSSAPLRSSTTAFRDNSTSVPNRGASPSLVRVSGIDHTGPVQGRTERERAPTETHEGPRVRSTVPSRSGPNDWRGQNDVGRRGRGGTRWCLTEMIEGLRQVSSYIRRPATSFLCVSTHINTRYVYTGTTPAFVAVFALSGSLRPPRSSSSALFVSLSLSLCSVFLPKYFCGIFPRTLLSVPPLPPDISSERFHSTAVVSC